MSSYVYFGLKVDSGETIGVAYWGSGSKMYGRVQDAIGYSNEAREFTEEDFYKACNEIDDEINEYNKGIELYNLLLSSNTSSEDKFDYAKEIIEYKDNIKILENSKQWLKFFIELDGFNDDGDTIIKKVVWFD